MAILGKSKICPFKEDNALIKRINYKDAKFLKKFITDQGKIIPGHVTGVSAKYQRLIEFVVFVENYWRQYEIYNMPRM